MVGKRGRGPCPQADTKNGDVSFIDPGSAVYQSSVIVTSVPPPTCFAT